MLNPEQKFSVNPIPVEILEYDNGSVAFLNHVFPTWVRSSTTGLWIFQYLKENPSTISQMVSAVANHYGLPTDAVRETTISFLQEMIFTHFLIPWDSAQEESVPTLPRVVELSELGLQELWLDVTSLCRGACRHCYKPKNDTYHFPVSELEDLLAQAKTLGVANLTLSGGEPLLHPEFSRFMMLARRVSDWTIKVIMAGQRTSSEIVDALMENADIVEVSLDGLDKDTHDVIRGEGAFECAVRLLKLLHEHKDRHRTKVGIAFTPLPQNINQMQELDELGYAIGINFIHFNHLKRPASLSRDIPKHDKLLGQELFNKAIRNFEELTIGMWDTRHKIELRGRRPISLDKSFVPYYDLLNLVKKRNCGAGITVLSITEKGDVYPCPALQAFPETCLGNWIRERDLPELYCRARRWNESVFSVDDCDQCKACHLRYLCGGGCRARAHSLAGQDIVCETILQSYDAFFQFARLLVKAGSIDAELVSKISKEEAELNEKGGKRRFEHKRCA